VNDVRLDAGDDVVDEVTLEGEGGEEEVFGASLVDTTTTIKFAVLCKVNAIAHGYSGASAGVIPPFILEEISVVGDGKVNVLMGAAQAVNEKGGNISEASGFGAKSFGIDAESFGNVGDLGGNEEDAGSFV